MKKTMYGLYHVEVLMDDSERHSMPFIFPRILDHCHRINALHLFSLENKMSIKAALVSDAE